MYVVLLPFQEGAEFAYFIQERFSDLRIIPIRKSKLKATYTRSVGYNTTVRLTYLIFTISKLATAPIKRTSITTSDRYTNINISAPIIIYGKVICALNRPVDNQFRGVRAICRPIIQLQFRCLWRIILVFISRLGVAPKQKHRAYYQTQHRIQSLFHNKISSYTLISILLRRFAGMLTLYNGGSAFPRRFLLIIDVWSLGVRPEPWPLNGDPCRRAELSPKFSRNRANSCVCVCVCVCVCRQTTLEA